MSMQRPLPRLEPVNRAFWTGGAEGELRICRCGDCGLWIHPPQPVCRQCLSENVAAEAVAGTGVIDTYTVNHRAWSPGLEVPYVVAIVQLDEQPDLRLMTNIVGCPADAVAIDMPVEVEFREQDGVFAPVFRPI